MHDSALRPEISTTPMAICLLGRFRVLHLGQPVSFRADGKMASLLRRIACQTQGVSRETLLDTLWPDIDRCLAGQSLNTLVYETRRLFGPGLHGRAPLVFEQACYRLNLEAGVAVDVTLFDEWLDTAGELAAKGRSDEASCLYERALGLYEGDLCLTDEVDSVIERERVRTRFRDALSALAAHHYARENFDACLHYTTQLLRSDPCREDAHRLAMRAYLRKGVRAQALRQYQLCCQVLRSEFDAGPEEDTIRLYEEARGARQVGCQERD